MTTIIDQDNIDYDVTALDNTDSIYQGEGEEIHTVDTTNGALTVELRDADTVPGFHKRFFDVGGNIETNAVTFQTQSSQNIDGASSVTWGQQNNSYVDLWSDGSNWFTSLKQSATSFGGDSVQTDEVSGIRTVNPATESAVKSAISNASAGDIIWAVGDWTVTSPITLDKQITFKHTGEITLQSDLFHIGHNSQTFGTQIHLDSVTGQAYNDGNTAFYCQNTSQIYLRFNAIQDCQRILYAHAATSGVRPLDITVEGQRASQFTTAFDLHSENDTVEGIRLNNLTIFNTTTTWKARGSNFNGLHWVQSTTFHGYTAARNVTEIDESGGAGSSVYDLTFLGSGSYTIADNSTIQAADADSTWGQPFRGKVVNGCVYAGHQSFSTVQDAINYADTNDHNTTVVPPGNYGSIDIPTQNTVIGLGRSSAGGVNFSGGTSDHAVDFTGSDATVRNVAASTTAGGGTTFNAFNVGNISATIENCTINESDNYGIWVDDSWIDVRGCLFKGPTDADNLFLTANSADNVIVGNVILGSSFTNNGSGNQITGNS